MDESDIIEGLKPVCLCMGITKKALLRHIAAGTRSVKGLQRASGAGSGSCRGKTCTSRIEALLKSTSENRHRSTNRYS